MRSIPLLALLVLAPTSTLTGCLDRPGCAYDLPAAPAEETDSMAWLLREFHGCDAAFEVGIDHFVTELIPHTLWLSGDDLADPEAFTHTGLQPGHVTHLPPPPDDVQPQNADGYIAFAHTDCTVPELEALLVRSDQHVVLDQDGSYERSYTNDRATFEAAWDSERFEAIDDRLDRFGDDFDPAGVEDALLGADDLQTTAFLEMELGQAQLVTDFRHRVLTGTGAAMGTLASVQLQWLVEATNEGLDAATVQSYELRVLVSDDADGSYLGHAHWIEDGGVILGGMDDAIVPAGHLDRLLDGATRLAGICDGTVALPEEP